MSDLFALTLTEGSGQQSRADRRRAQLLHEGLQYGVQERAEPVAGRSLRRYAPPASSGAPSQLPVNAGPGSGARASGFGLGREKIEEWSDLVIGLSGMPHCRFSVD
jgi:hypothetical protein